MVPIQEVLNRPIEGTNMYGYSSEISGIMASPQDQDTWINSNEVPIVSAQGTNDNVNYNCAHNKTIGALIY